MKATILYVLLFSLPLLGFTDVPEGKNGHLYDPGLTMTKRADNAPVELDNIASLVGQWDVTMQTPTEDNQVTSQVAKASITWMNRGHGLMERLQFKDNSLKVLRHQMVFYTYQATNSLYGMGIADSQTRSVSIYSGKKVDESLVLRNTVRPRGSMVMLMEKYQLNILGKDEFTTSYQTSSDNGQQWKMLLKKTYKRRQVSADFMPNATGFGSPSLNRVPADKDLDFLIGDWNSIQELSRPNAQPTKFPSRSTAVFALGGHAILEFNSYDVDPSLPNCATSIIRIYNPAMRRWESLYITNRTNGLLFFGGDREGDQIILHNFDTHMGHASIPYYIFHDIEKDKYLWHAEVSQDGGKSFQTNWKITTTRK